MDKQEQKRLLDLVLDLYWEEDRMSSCGVDTLNELEKLVRTLV